MNIPIVIICFNNYKYVENTINQIFSINKTYFDNIIIMDNCSTCPDTLEYLKNVKCKVVYNTVNKGPWVNAYPEFYATLPDKFVLTDADLEFNKNLPTNFIDILSELSDKYNCYKIGFALDISDFDKMFQSTYFDNTNIYEWESRFWLCKKYHKDYELYSAGVDTTFCIANKKYASEFDREYAFMRVAGNFTAKHIPWYIDNKIYNIYENYLLNETFNKFSSSNNMIVSYICANYLKINKNNEFFFIKNDTNNPNLNFWKNIYSSWESDTFNVFDKYLNINKIFIDIGGWIATTCMYGSRKSKYVYSIEADTASFNDMTLNMNTNCKKNYTLINKAIYNVNDVELKFGKNKFLINSTMNDSTSQIYNDNDFSSEYYPIKSITLNKIISDNNINPSDISLIKVDIEGGEEHILNELYHVYSTYHVPLYISFHYDWWNDKNLNRFPFLTDHIKNLIITNPFISILLD